ncbi:MAG: DnaB-like helicase C-terminal domain-containing protein [Smithella sp.]
MKKNNNVVHLPGNLSPLRNPIFSVVKNIERSYQRRKSDKDLHMGVSWLNEMTGGHKQHGFILVPGDPLLMRATVFKASMEADNIPVALFSQKDRESIVLEMISLETGIHAMDLKEGRLRLDDWPVLTFAAGRLIDLPVFIEKPGDIMEACARARLLAENSGIKALFIDDPTFFYPGIDFPDDPEVAGSFKELSRELKMPIFAGFSG